MEETRLAIRNIVTGFSLGLTSLIVLPVRGWRQNMWPGLWVGGHLRDCCMSQSQLWEIVHGVYSLLYINWYEASCTHHKHCGSISMAGKVWAILFGMPLPTTAAIIISENLTN